MWHSFFALLIVVNLLFKLAKSLLLSDDRRSFIARRWDGVVGFSMLTDEIGLYSSASERAKATLSRTDVSRWSIE